MNFLVDISFLLIGGTILYFGAEWLVKGSAGLARNFGVRELVIGLTVIAYGTSAPELAVSSAAILKDSSPFVLGNVIGSCIANLALILGLTAVIAPPRVDAALIKRELPWLVASVAVIPLVLLDGVISRLEASLLLSFSILFTLVTMLSAKKTERTVQKVEIRRVSKRGVLHLSCLTLVGLVLLVLGGEFFVKGAQALALKFGLSERVVGLTVVAFGTSLPELAACLVAALRNHESLAVGNIIGSNIFNIFLILGVVGLIHPISGSVGELQLDILFLAGITLFGVVSMRTARRITRAEGLLLSAGYLTFLTLLILGK